MVFNCTFFLLRYTGIVKQRQLLLCCYSCCSGSSCCAGLVCICSMERRLKAMAQWQTGLNAASFGLSIRLLKLILGDGVKSKKAEEWLSNVPQTHWIFVWIGSIGAKWRKWKLNSTFKGSVSQIVSVSCAYFSSWEFKICTLNVHHLHFQAK